MDIYSVLFEIVGEGKKKCERYRFTDEYKDKLGNNAEKDLFEIIKKTCSLYLDFNDEKSGFIPAFVWGDQRSFALEDLDESSISLLKSINVTKLPLVIKARIADILGLVCKDTEMVKTAAISYRELFELTFDITRWTYCVEMIQRAIEISRKLGKKETVYVDCCKTAYDYLIRVDGTDKLYFSLKILKIIIDRKYGDVDDLLVLIEKIIENSQDNVDKVEEAYQIKNDLLKWKKASSSSIKQTKVDLAAFLEKAAEKAMEDGTRGVYIAEKYLQKAVNLYHGVGYAANEKSAHKKLIEVQKEKVKTFQTIKHEIDIKDACEIVVESLEGLSFEESVIQMLRCTPFFERKEIAKQVKKDTKTFVMRSLTGTAVVNKKGQNILKLQPLDIQNPEGDKKLFEQHMYYKANEQEDMVGNIYIRGYINEIRKRFSFEEKDILFLTTDNSIIPEGRESIFAEALYHGLKGDLYVALHILAPQVENLFRGIAEMAGGITVTLRDDGVSEEKTLASIFDIPELQDCYDADILFLFQGLMNKRAGANLRNLIAHGILDESDAYKGTSLYFFAAVMRVLMFTSKGALNIIRNCEKFKNA